VQGNEKIYPLQADCFFDFEDGRTEISEANLSVSAENIKAR
jgi:hypothetical protein